MPDHKPAEFKTCAVCERTLLTGERSWDYAEPGGDFRSVCTLCKSRAESSGWVPAGLAGAGALPVQRSRGRRFALRERSGRKPVEAAARERNEAPAPPAGSPEIKEEEELAARFAAIAGLARRPAAREGMATESDAEPAHYAVRDSDSPDELTEEQVINRAIRVFNVSDAQRQVGRLRRTLGGPKASVRRAQEGRDTAVLVVAWELSWYEWEVEVGDGKAEVTEVRKGTELSELGDPGPPWNARLDEEGQLTLDAV